MNEYDVVVVGGGPAGAAAAIFCAQHGRRVALLEHRQFPRHKVCGDVINPECWPVLERLGVGPALRDRSPYPLGGARFTDARGHDLSLALPGLSSMPRRILDACLLERARGCGVAVFEQTTVHQLHGQWRLITAAAEFSAPVVIGADGRHSTIARRVGLERPRRPWPTPVAFQSHFPAPPQLDNRVQLHLFPGGYAGLVRLDGAEANLCVVVDRPDLRRHADVVSLFARTVWQNPQFRQLELLPVPLAPLRSAHPVWRRANRPAGRGVFLVGDALRVVEPFTGQGIFFALRTAELAAELLAAGPAAYAAAVARLYRQRSMINRFLRRSLYHHRLGELTLAILARHPRSAGRLAGNVIGGDR